MGKPTVKSKKHNDLKEREICADLKRDIPTSGILGQFRILVVILVSTSSNPCERIQTPTPLRFLPYSYPNPAPLSFIQGNYAVPQSPMTTVSAPFSAALKAGDLNV